MRYVPLTASLRLVYDIINKLKKKKKQHDEYNLGWERNFYATFGENWYGVQLLFSGGRKKN